MRAASYLAFGYFLPRNIQKHTYRCDRNYVINSRSMGCDSFLHDAKAASLWQKEDDNRLELVTHELDRQQADTKTGSSWKTLTE